MHRIIFLLICILPQTVSLAINKLDWSRLEKWVSTPPEIITVKFLNQNTQNLIFEQSEIFEALIDTDQSRSKIKHQIDDLINLFPDGRSHKKENDEDSFFGIDINHYKILNTETVKKYRQLFSQINQKNLNNNLLSIDQNFENDLKTLETADKTKSKVAKDLKWLNQNLRNYLDEWHNLSKSIDENKHLRNNAKTIWAEFEKTKLPILEKIINLNLISTVKLEDDNSYKNQDNGIQLVKISVAGRNLYLDQYSHLVKFLKSN